MQGSELDTGLDLAEISAYSAYWEQTRTNYGPFECTKTMRFVRSFWGGVNIEGIKTKIGRESD